MENYYYDKIAIDYDLKRKKPWKPLKKFIKQLKEKGYFFNGVCIDLGCANGRHFEIFKNLNNKLIGIDNSLEFLKIAQERLRDSTQYLKGKSNNIQLIHGDLNFIPIRAQTIQLIFSIASIHHIKCKTKREKAISQIFNLLDDNGYFLLTLWRRWQKNFKRDFISDWFKRKLNPKYKKKQKELDLKEFGDKFVPWTVSRENFTYNRFYHLFSKREIKKLMMHFKVIEFKKRGGSTNKDNFFVLAQK